MARSVAAQLVYWTVCLMICVAVFALALLDVREVAKQFATLQQAGVSRVYGRYTAGYQVTHEGLHAACAQTCRAWQDQPEPYGWGCCR